MHRATPIGWLALCRPAPLPPKSAAFALGFARDSAAALARARDAVCGATALDVDAIAAARLTALTSVVPRLQNRTLDRLSLRLYSIMRVNTLSPEGALRQAWSTPDKSPHQMEFPWDTAFHAWGQR